MTTSNLIDIKDVAAYFNVSVSTIHRMRHGDPEFPRPRRVARNCVRWLRSEVEAYAGRLQTCFIFAFPFGSDEPFGNSD